MSGTVNMLAEHRDELEETSVGTNWNRLLQQHDARPEPAVQAVHEVGLTRVVHLICSS